MQKTTNLVYPVLIVATIFTAFAFLIFSNNIKPVQGSAPIYESNNSTTTRSTDASAATSSVVCKTNCQIASVIVNQPASAGYVRIWNATSTATSTYSNDQASTTAAITWGKPIAKITGAGDAFGTLIYDSAADNGIVIETSVGFDGEYTITWKR